MTENNVAKLQLELAKAVRAESVLRQRVAEIQDQIVAIDCSDHLCHHITYDHCSPLAPTDRLALSNATVKLHGIQAELRAATDLTEGLFKQLDELLV